MKLLALFVGVEIMFGLWAAMFTTKSIRDWAKFLGVLHIVWCLILVGLFLIVWGVSYTP